MAHTCMANSYCSCPYTLLLSAQAMDHPGNELCMSAWLPARPRLPLNLSHCLLCQWLLMRLQRGLVTCWLWQSQRRTSAALVSRHTAGTENMQQRKQ